MRIESTFQTNLRAILLSIVACASFVLQPIHVALHVGQHDHTSSASADQDLHWHVESGHDHADHHRDDHHGGETQSEGLELAAARSHAGEDDHAPHPIEDHLEQQLDSYAVRVLLQTVLAPAEAEIAPDVPPLRLASYAVVELASPPPRPELRSAAPRAPPIAS